MNDLPDVDKLSYTEAQQQIQKMLRSLKQNLTTNEDSINPYGALAQCIIAIQAKYNLDIIDIEVLNRSSKAKKLILPTEELIAEEVPATFVDSLDLVTSNLSYDAKDSISVHQFFCGTCDDDMINVFLDEATAFENQTSYFGTNPVSEKAKIRNMLKELKTDLVANGTEINPYGKLAKCIEAIQEKTNLKVIDINKLKK
ncbi:MAG: hypothetical protein WC627_09650 [Legionella sp.]|jgi:hypothetical protein